MPVSAKQYELNLEPISPELALVDPHLRQQVRSADHAQRESRFAVAVAVDAPPAKTGAGPPGAAARTWRRPRFLAAGVLAVVGAFVAISMLAPRLRQERLSTQEPKASADGRAERRARAVVPQRELTQTIRPVNLTFSARKPLRWAPVRYATFYNVVLTRGKSRVLDLWPRRAELSLSTLRRSGGSHLRAGEYHWFVYPGFGQRRPLRSGSTVYGKLAAKGVLTVPQRGTG